MFGLLELLFLFSSMKIDVKIEQTSDERKRRRVCKAFLVMMTLTFLSMTNNERDEKGGLKDDEN